jgi:predicted DCC family thiol-disulfide oxidoreductase YuxK
MDEPWGPRADGPATASRGKLAVLYDGGCKVCRVGVEAIRMFDNADSVELLDLHDEGARARFPALKVDNLLEELHVVDDRGRVYCGARAINEVLRHQRGLRRYLAYLWYVPGYAWLADIQYKRIAALRYGHAPKGNLSASPSREH